jgi:hypothetical protein
MIPATIQILQTHLDENRLAQLGLRVQVAQGEVLADETTNQKLQALEAAEKSLDWQIKAAWADAIHQATETARAALAPLPTFGPYAPTPLVR